MFIEDRNISPEAQDIAKLAFVISSQEGHSSIDIEHVLLALLIDSDKFLPGLFDELGINTALLIEDVQAVIQSHGNYSNVAVDERNIKITKRVAEAMEFANLEALRLSGGLIGPEHILLGILEAYEHASEQKSFAAKSLHKKGVTSEAVKFALRKL